ncbi:hypothetical protein AMJ57_01655 [Parcubacteria bacterium SG8_24]|nr:MAG: hypothetical protein AMJ57_01655 [Parcubacteria bacterium SG8_24]
MVKVEFTGKRPRGVSPDSVKAWVRRTCREAGERGDLRVDIAVTDDTAIRRLNRTYRGIDRTTDVLSFPYDEGPEFVLTGERGGTRHLGEIVISLPRVKVQARRDGRRVRDEFALMVVHGTLHLLGFDHETESDERRMFSLQQDILMGLGIL